MTGYTADGECSVSINGLKSHISRMTPSINALPSRHVQFALITGSMNSGHQKELSNNMSSEATLTADTVIL